MAESKTGGQLTFSMESLLLSSQRIRVPMPPAATPPVYTSVSQAHSSASAHGAAVAASSTQKVKGNG